MFSKANRSCERCVSLTFFQELSIGVELGYESQLVGQLGSFRSPRGLHSKMGGMCSTNAGHNWMYNTIGCTHSRMHNMVVYRAPWTHILCCTAKPVAQDSSVATNIVESLVLWQPPIESGDGDHLMQQPSE